MPAGQLSVHLGDVFAGRLDGDDAGRMTFAYASADPALALSMSIPPRYERYPDAECRPFFAGLLPEGAALDAAASARRIPVYDTFGLLAAFGGDCAGAVRLLPPGTPPEINQDYEPRDAEAFARLVAEIGGNPNFASDRRVRLSVAGAQAKTAVRLHDDQVFVPLNGSPSTHIIKVGSSSFPNLPENEAFCMLLARRCGLRAAEIALKALPDRRYCLVSRYDRIVSDTGVGEIHQEDFCQALGYLPARKYEVDDDSGEKVGPDLAECFALLRRTRRPGPDMLQFLGAVVFNYLIGNADAHAKNFSLLYDDGGVPSLAPFYDFVSTRIYPGLTARFAMRHGTVLDPDAMSREAWDALAEQASIRPSLVHNTARRLASIIVEEARGLIDAEFSPGPPAALIVNAIGERVNRLSRDLGLGIEADTPPLVLQPPG